MSRQINPTMRRQQRGKNRRLRAEFQLIFASRPPARTARMSLQHVPYVQHHPRLSLVAEALSPQPDQWEGSRTSHIQTEQAELKRRSQCIQEEESPQQSTGLPERSNSEPELFAPIRRRSLLQPGIATRKSWVENDPRQSLPSQLSSQQRQDDLQKHYYYDPAKPTSSPLSSIAALGPRFEDISPGPRTMTPNDLDYGHIGAFKLGSLRITNGTASPSPSMERPATRGGDDDYFMDGRDSAQSHRGKGLRSNTISAAQEIIKPPWVTRAESPLRQAQAQEPEDKPLRVNTHLPLPEFSAFNFTTESPTKSLDLAREYMQDLALSPFSFDSSPPRTPRLEATSKNTAVEDDLFEAEPRTPEIQEIHEPRSFDSGYHAEETPATKAVKGLRDLAPKPLAKADSGYSSNVSLRSFKGNSAPAVPAKEAPPTPPKEPGSRVASSAYSVTSSYSEVSEVTIRSKRSLPALPTEEMPAPSRQAPPVPLKHSSVQNSGKVIPAPPLPHKSPKQEWAAASLRPQVIVTAKHARQQSLPAVPQALRDEFAPANSPSSSIGSLNSSNSTSRWRKDKKRPQSIQPQPVYTVQAFRTSPEELSIPPVPAEVSRHLEERVDGFPVACFPNTYEGTNHLRRTVSKETLGTIFSVGSAEYRDEPTFARLQSALPPVPVHATIPENPTPKPEANRRYTYQRASPATPAPISNTKHRKSLQAIPRKVAPRSQQAFENHLTSYENVSSSIGKSPYDIALGPIAKRPTAQERAKSMTSQLEAEARERFASARSVSQESFQTVQRSTSYDFIANQNPFASSTNSSRQSSGSKPPQAHAKWSGFGSASSSPMPTSVLVQQRSNPNLSAQDDGRKFSMRSQERVKSPPPVSMQTQRKAVHTQTSSHVVVPPSRTPPLPPREARDRTPPAPPPHFSPPLEEDQWASQKNFWAERRKSAGEALQGRKSIDVRRPESAKQSLDYQQRPQVLKSHVSWDASQRWNRAGEYDHTYGSYEHNKENWHYYQQQPLPSQPYHHQNYHRQQGQEEDYYDAPSEDFEQEHLPQTIHNHQTSTSSMLVLDRFSGGLGYGYEPGAGLGGSAGTRNAGKMAGGGRKGVDVSMHYGVDFSDVPVFLTRVNVEG